MTFFQEWSRFSHLGKYVPGISITHYLHNLHTIFGYAQVVLFIVGVIAIVRAKKIIDFGIPFCLIAFNIIINTLAGAEVFHWTGSIGELRYIAVVAPFVGIVAVYGLSEVLPRVTPRWVQLAFSLLVLGTIVFNCTLTTHPRRWSTYDRTAIAVTRELRSDYPDLTLLSNNSVVAYVMDVAPSGGAHFAKLDLDGLAEYPECLVLWDPYPSNPRFDRTTMTKERMVDDSTMVLLEGYSDQSAGFLVLSRSTRASEPVPANIPPGSDTETPK